MKFYEFVLLINQEANISDMQKIIEHYREITNKFGGSFIASEYWGLKNIFHEIKKNKKVHFICFKIKSHALIINKIKEDYRYNENILRGFEFKIDNINCNNLFAINNSKK